MTRYNSTCPVTSAARSAALDAKSDSCVGASMGAPSWRMRHDSWSMRPGMKLYSSGNGQLQSPQVATGSVDRDKQADGATPTTACSPLPFYWIVLTATNKDQKLVKGKEDKRDDLVTHVVDQVPDLEALGGTLLPLVVVLGHALGQKGAVANVVCQEAVLGNVAGELVL